MRLSPFLWHFVTTQAREGIETSDINTQIENLTKVTTQAREGIETVVLTDNNDKGIVTTQAREGIETPSTLLPAKPPQVTTQEK